MVYLPNITSAGARHFTSGERMVFLLAISLDHASMFLAFGAFRVVVDTNQNHLAHVFCHFGRIVLALDLLDGSIRIFIVLQLQHHCRLIDIILLRQNSDVKRFNFIFFSQC